MKRNKKGFTIVELVVVISVIAILSAVIIPIITGLINQTRISNDIILTRDLNNAITRYEIKHKADDTYNAPETMTDLVLAMDEMGYTIERISASATNAEITWDSVNNRFILYTDGEREFWDHNTIPTEDKLKLWVVSTTYDSTKGFSVYLKNGYTGTTINNVSTGLDVGNNDGITKINYSHTGTPQNVVIRTNGGTLTVNAPADTIKHYGYAESVNIVAVASASYHENGNVPFIQISKGRIEIEKTGNVNGIHVANVQTVAANGEITKTENTFTHNVVLTLNGNEVKLTRDTIGTDISEAVLVCEVQENATSNEFIWLVGDGTIENAQVYVTSTNTTPNTSVASTITTNNASAAAIAIANNATNTGTEEAPVYTAVEAGTSAENAQVASALKGSGTEEDPFLVYDYATMQKISDFYDKDYYYFAVDMSKTDNGKIDCLNTWVAVNINGSFDGKGVVFNNVNNQLFRSVGKAPSDDVYTIKNLTINANINITGYGAAAIRQAGNNLVLDTVTVHGYIEGNNGAAAFVCFGPGNITTNNPDNQESMNWLFKNCYADATVVATGDVAVGFVKHPYCYASQKGGNATAQASCLLTIEDSIFEGKLSALSGTYTRKYFVGNANDMLVKTIYSSEFLNAYGNPEGTLYATPTTKTEDGIFFIGNYPGEGKKISGYADYGTCMDAYLGSNAVLTKTTGTLPSKYNVFTITKVSGAVSAKVALEIAPNGKDETGSYLGTFMEESIDLSGISGTFTTSEIKYFDISVNRSGVNTSGVSSNGKTYNIYGSFYGTTYASACVRVIQYDSNGNVINITTFSFKK